MGPSKGPMHTLLYAVPPNLQQATANPCLCWRLLDTHGQVWVNLFWSHCSFLLGPGPHKVLFVPSKSLFLQSGVSSDGSKVELMATSSKRVYAIPRSSAPRAADPAAVHCLVPPQETLKHSSASVSVGSLFPGVHEFVCYILPVIIKSISQKYVICLRISGLIVVKKLHQK